MVVRCPDAADALRRLCLPEARGPSTARDSNVVPFWVCYGFILVWDHVTREMEWELQVGKLKKRLGT